MIPEAELIEMEERAQYGDDYEFTRRSVITLVTEVRRLRRSLNRACDLAQEWSEGEGQFDHRIYELREDEF